MIGSTQIQLAQDLEIFVQGPLLTSSEYLALPFCIRGDHSGRWVNSHLISPLLSKPLIETESNPDVPVIDYSRRFWLPYNCRYKRLNYNEFANEYLVKKHPVVHFTRDSNIRRSLKIMTTGGAICHTIYDENSHQCQ